MDAIGAGRSRRSAWAEAPFRLFLASLAPLALVIPLRYLYFSDDDPITVFLLGPAFEESLKLAGVILALTAASIALRGGRDPALALRYWLFLLPWLVGAVYGMVEGVVAYPGQGGIAFTMREFAHATFVALSLAGALGIWRGFSAPVFGIGFGFGAGYAAHIWFNSLLLLTDRYDTLYVYQAIYLAVVFFLALAVLAWEVRKEPASAETRAFLPESGRRVHP